MLSLPRHWPISLRLLPRYSTQRSERAGRASVLHNLRSSDPSPLAAISSQKAPFHLHSPRRQNGASAVRSAQAKYETLEPGSPSDRGIDEATQLRPDTRFQDLADKGLVDKTVIETITRRMGLSTMTQVQSLTINEALKGVDVLAQAKTGTGKTIGFLLPVLQNILTEDSSLLQRGSNFQRGRGRRTSNIRAIVISPTRELAEQIASEARKLVGNTGVVVQNAVGGTQKSYHLRQMREQGCHILVGTPGRLNDLFSDPASGVHAPLLSALVLDEADRLMDQGFWPAIQQFQETLPDRSERDRQTLMFSATMPPEVVQLVRQTMKPNLHYVKTVQENEQPTHERVKQFMVSVPGMENQLAAVMELCEREIKKAAENPDSRPFKAIAYFNVTIEAVVASRIFHQLREHAKLTGEKTLSSPTAAFPLGKTPVFEIHSRLTQQARTRAADNFRRSRSAILMSSDVTARGMDFPGVTHVIQVGLPQTRDAYIHRIGRTARAGAEGEGWLIVPQYALRESRARLGQLPLKVDRSLTTAEANFTNASEGIPEEAERIVSMIRDKAMSVDPGMKSALYNNLMGPNLWMGKNKLGMLLESLFKVQFGSDPPPISHSMASRTGLLGVSSVKIGKPPLQDYVESAPRRGSSRGSDSGYGSSHFARRDRDSSPKRGGYGRSRGRPEYEPFGRERRDMRAAGDRRSGTSYGSQRRRQPAW